MKRLAIARLWHEGNSFSPVPTTAESFRAVEWHCGEAAAVFHRGNATEGGAVVAFPEEHPDWQGVFLRCAGASPAGPLAAGLHETIRAEIVAGLESGGPWDGVYLSLHGALVAERVDSPDRELIEAVRAAIGHTPLAVTFDLHANLDPAIAPLIDVAAGYKTHPHVDMDATATRALGLLDRIVAGDIRPVCAVAKTGRILPSINMRTAAGPMAEIEAVARNLEARHGLLDATAYGGFTYGDVPYAGASAMVCADGDRTLAQNAADELAEVITQRRDDFFMTLPGPAEGIAQALAAPSGLVAVIDGADNPFSGGIADTPALFRAVVDAAPDVPTVFAFFHDPVVVTEVHRLGEGGHFEGTLGGRLTADYGAPVPVSARIERLTDGQFINRGPMQTHMAIDLGRTAVLVMDAIRVIVTEHGWAANDPAYFDLHGIDLDATRLLCVKAKNHFCAAFEEQCRAIIDIDAPGPACIDFSQLPFRRASL
ncbi:MAG: M81 family metallopeptidase [Alphaproteobacteria bacterium]